MAVPNKAVTMSVEELNIAIGEYFDACGEGGRFPTEAGMLLRLGIGAEEYRALGKDAGAAQVFESARLRRTDWLENRMVTESRVATGCMNALKQAKNGGYVDKAANEPRERRLTIRLEGVGEGAGG